MRGRWFRVYEDFIDDPKILQLSANLLVTLFQLWALASINDGLLPPLKDMSLRLRMRPDWLAKRLEKLQELGLIDNKNNELRPHNWAKRQFKSDSSNERVKRYRKRQSNVTRNGHETPPDTDSEVEKGNIPLGNISRSLPAERVTRNAAEAAASGASPKGCAPAAAADPEAERDRMQEEAQRENALRDRYAEEWRVQQEFLAQEVARLGLNGQAH